jgi:hypothetical protein
MFNGMVKEIYDSHDHALLWTSRPFCGMPSYLISTWYGGEILTNIQNTLNRIPRPVNFLMLNFLLFYVLCLVLQIRPWISCAGALAYGLCSFLYVIIGTGHATKAHTLTYMALVVAGVLLAYKRKPLWGSLLTAFGLSWMFSANHLQMTYYAAMMCGVTVIAYGIAAWRSNAIPRYLKTSGMLLLAVLLAFGTNFGRLYTTYEYGKYSMRGKSELSGDDNRTSGLNRDYILDYSYDAGEALSAFIPRIKGGGHAENLGEKSEVYKLLARQDRNLARQIAERLPLYWGEQPIVMASFYFGAVLCFLFVFGLFVVRGPDKWWISAVVIIAFVLSLGKNLPLISNLMIDYFPGYSKFRDVKNIIVIQQFAMALMGILAVREIAAAPKREALLRPALYAWMITGGLALVLALIPGIAGSFVSPSDAAYQAQGWPQQLIDALRVDRRAVLQTDAWRSFAFVSAAMAVIWLFIKQKINASVALTGWIFLILLDMLPIDKKYLNDSNYSTKSKKQATTIKASVADMEILKDKTLNYRVLSLQNPFNDGLTAYFHRSLGGYHGAKLKRYQEIIDRYLTDEVRRLQAATPDEQAALLPSMTAVNLLNAKYLIDDPNQPPTLNTNVFGPVWLVDSVVVADNADAEIAALGRYPLNKVAIIDRRFNIGHVGAASGSAIELQQFKPDELSYRADIRQPQALAVFSEIWYPKGWKAYIDGQEAEIVRADYLLRALVVPQGTHEIVFRFHPASYYTGNKVALASSLLLLFAAAGSLAVYLKNRRNEQN